LLTNLKGELSSIIKCLENCKHFKSAKHSILSCSINNYLRTGEILFFLEIIDYIYYLEGKYIFRKELWNDLRKLFKTYQINRNENLKKLARRQVEQASIHGRFVYDRTISRTPLIKGLEFNHAILLDADNLKAKELYVSLTRGSNI